MAIKMIHRRIIIVESIDEYALSVYALSKEKRSKAIGKTFYSKHLNATFIMPSQRTLEIAITEAEKFKRRKKISAEKFRTVYESKIFNSVYLINNPVPFMWLKSGVFLVDELEIIAFLRQREKASVINEEKFENAYLNVVCENI